MVPVISQSSCASALMIHPASSGLQVRGGSWVLARVKHRCGSTHSNRVAGFDRYGYGCQDIIPVAYHTHFGSVTGIDVYFDHQPWKMPDIHQQATFVIHHEK